MIYLLQLLIDLKKKKGNNEEETVCKKHLVWLGELSNSEPINKTVGGVKENTAADYYKPTYVSSEYRDAKQPGKPETPKEKTTTTTTKINQKTMQLKM